MLKWKRRTGNMNLVYFMIILITLTTVASASTVQAATYQYFFRVKILSQSDLPTENIANLLAQELSRIRIDSIINSQPAGVFEAELVSRNFDIVFSEFLWPNVDVDPTVYFSEIGSGNYWGLDDEMTGGALNEELLRAGLIENDLTERENIYHQWQENLVDELLPVIPCYSSVETYVSWDTLTGWDHEDGIAASLPYMEWSAEHYGQANESVFVDYLDEWDILNPLFVDDNFVISLIAEPLFRVDYDNNPVPVLATGWAFSENETVLTITLREDVLWQPDKDNLYTSEYFDADDVLFSILAYQEFSTVGTYFKWIESVEKINNTAVEITIDGDKDTVDRQPFAPALLSLNTLILPEHYLNVSVVDGLPDTTSPEWTDYSLLGMGTGMYYFVAGQYQEGVQAVLYSNSDWWGSTPSGYNEDLDIEQYTFRFLTTLNTIQLEFQGGNLDIYKDYRETDTDFDVAPYLKKTRNSFDMTYLGFNLKSTSCPEIGDQTLTEDGTMSKGLAVRKAIAHLLNKNDLDDKTEIEIELADSPLSVRFGSFIKSDITIYETDLEKAKNFMLKAGYDPNTIPAPGFTTISTIMSIFILTVMVSIYSSKKTKK
ncbi:MAG: ABC transporter substrate-binding protein [Candidatus Heimdallarchaeota archaeon]